MQMQEIDFNTENVLQKWTYQKINVSPEIRSLSFCQGQKRGGRQAEK